MHNLIVKKIKLKNVFIFEILKEDKDIALSFSFSYISTNDFYPNGEERYDLKSLIVKNFEQNKSINILSDDFIFMDSLYENLIENGSYTLTENELTKYIELLPLNLNVKTLNENSYDCDCCGSITSKEIQIKNINKKLMKTYKLNDHFGGDLPNLYEILLISILKKDNL